MSDRELRGEHESINHVILTLKFFSSNTNVLNTTFQVVNGKWEHDSYAKTLSQMHSPKVKYTYYRIVSVP